MEDGVINTEVIQRKEDRLEVLAFMAKKFALESKDFDLLIIEEYAYSGAGGSRSATVQAELGGVIRALFAARGVPIVEVPISLWKAVTGIRRKKSSLLEVSDYLNAVAEKFKLRFKTVDEADAFLLFQTVRLCCTRTEMQRFAGAEKIRAKCQKLKINWDELCTPKP